MPDGMCLLCADTPHRPSAWCGPTDHDYAVLDPARLYCRKCGGVKVIGAASLNVGMPR